MGVDVYVYDDTMTPLTSSSIDIIEVDHGGTKIDLQTSAKLSSGDYGATLKTPSPLSPVNVVVDDNSGQLAATTLGHLNSKVQARLDVALYPVPVGSAGYSTGGGGGGPAHGTGSGSSLAPDQIATYVQKQISDGRWNEREATGVLKLVETVLWALTHLQLLDSDLHRRLERWLNQLENLGIRIRAVRSQGGVRADGSKYQGQEVKPKVFKAGAGMDSD